jgi:hypothetical protein
MIFYQKLIAVAKHLAYFDTQLIQHSSLKGRELWVRIGVYPREEQPKGSLLR